MNKSPGPRPSWQHQIVRDMDWMLSSPPLLLPSAPNAASPDIHWVSNQDCQRMYAVSQSWLAELDRQPNLLQTAINNNRDHRLGSYFETLLAFWLSWPENPLFRLIAKNLAIRDRNRTLGEMDFLVQSRENCEFQHWEVAVKFYLGTSPGGHYANWQGPGLKDRLDIKVDHLLQHQLRLGESAQAKKAFQSIGIPACQPRPVCFLKGRLYYPLTAHIPDWAPHDANPQHLHAWWLSFDEFIQRYRHSPLQWLLLPRTAWLTPLPVSPLVEHRLYNPQQLLEHLQQDADNRAIAIIGVAVNTSNQTVEELTRGFITPSHWPLPS